MPVRNAGPYLDASVASILSQSHRDFELVAGDDGSTDGSLERLERWARQDSRVRVHRSEQGRGPAHSSNWVVGLARHAIVARMDADDISNPRRLEVQLAALKEHPEAVLVGTLSHFIDRHDREVSPPIRSRLRNLETHRAPFPHGSIMFRRSAFDRIGGYRSACDYWEDQDLYWRMAQVGHLLVLPEAHYRYRYNPGQARLSVETHRVERAIDLFYRCLAAREAGEDYEAILDAPGEGGVRPKTYRALASLQLMAGRRPVLLRRLVESDQFRMGRESLTALAWCTAAFLSPTGLRLALRAYAHGREAWLGRGGLSEPVEWAPQVRSVVTPEPVAAEAA